MWKRHKWILIGLALFIGLTLAGLYESATHVGRGWLRGEAFFDGRPTSWWREAVVHDIGTSPPSWWNGIRERMGFEEKPDVTLQLVRDPQSHQVLTELTNDQDERVVRFARRFLDLREAELDSADSFSCRVEWQFFLAMERMSSHIH